MTRKRMRTALDKATTKAVVELVRLHQRFHGYGSKVVHSAVRRYVTDAGRTERLHLLTGRTAQPVTMQSEYLQAAYDDLENRIHELEEQEELDSIRPDLDGKQIMELLDIKPGPEVGRAYKFLLEMRLEHGPLGEQRAQEELLKWWESNR